MIEFIYIPIILILYFRTYKYCYLIDDHVPRDGYMYVITTGKHSDQSFFDKQKSVLSTFTNIIVFIFVCGYIHYFWGWKAALLYAVFPLNVSGVAWNTGNYYMSTVLLILSTHLLVSLGSWIWVSMGLFMYAAALNSTLSSIPYIFFALVNPLGYLYLFPLFTFLFGKRMKTGIKKRKESHKNIGYSNSGKFEFKNLLHCPKVLAYYILLSFLPLKLGFFHSWGRDYKRYISVFNLSICSIVCLAFWKFMLMYNIYMALWWFLFMGIFSQFVILGQFTAERYTYLPNIAFCVVLSIAIPNDILYTILCTLWFCKTLEYIPAWRHNTRLFSYSLTQQPEAPENYSNLGSYYLDNGNPYEAIKPLLVADKITKGERNVLHCNIATCYIMMGERGNPEFFEHAAKWTKTAIQSAPLDKLEELNKQYNLICDKINKVNSILKNKLDTRGNIIIPSSSGPNRETRRRMK